MEEKSREEKPPVPVSKDETEESERKLIEAAQNGDKAAFGKLVRRHQKKLWRYIYCLVKSFDAAEDIVQEAFIKAYGNIKSFRAEYAFYPWLSTIARNLAFNQLHRLEKQESLEKLQEFGYDPASTDLGPLDELLEGENNKRLYAALMALPTQYRSVFVLRQFEKMDYAEIASYLKIPPGTVDSRLYRARTLLMEALKDLL